MSGSTGSPPRAESRGHQHQELESTYRSCFPEWRRHAEGFVDQDEAEDVVQEVVLMLISTRKAERIRELRPWVHAALKFEALHHVRSQRARSARDKDWEHLRAERGEHLMDPYPSHDQVLDVHQALDHNETFHLLFRLLGHEEGLSQLAGRHHMNRSTLWSRLRRAKPKLRAALEGY